MGTSSSFKMLIVISVITSTGGTMRNCLSLRAERLAEAVMALVYLRFYHYLRVEEANSE